MLFYLKDENVVMNNGNTKPGIIMLTEKYPPLYSGAGQQVFYFSQALVKSGYDVIVITQGRKPIPKKTVQEGVKVHRLTSFDGLILSSYFFGIYSALWILMHFRRFQILHVHGINLWGLPAMLIARLTGIRIIAKMTLSGEDDPSGLENMRLGIIRKQVYLFPHKIIALTNTQVEQYLKSEFKADKLLLIPNGVDLNIFFPVTMNEKIALRKKLNLPVAQKIVLFVGKISCRKGVRLLIDGWCEYLNRTDILLCLVGPEDIEKSFYQQIHYKIVAAGLEKQVIILGAKQNVGEYMQATDLFVLPSTREGLPNALLEAMACKLPAIVTDIPELRRTFDKEPPVLLMLKEYNPENLSKVILEIIDSESGKILGTRAHQFISEEFSMEKIVKKYDGLYHELYQVTEHGSPEKFNRN